METSGPRRQHLCPLAEKHKNTVEEAIEHLLSRADNSRGLSGADLTGRVSVSLEKYLLRDLPNPGHSDIETFVRDLRADDLCLIVACERGDGKPGRTLFQVSIPR